METITLYRPVGPHEMRLIAQSGFSRFPARLPEEPIFQLVCSEQYAREIVEQWNARDEGGFVVRFAAQAGVLERYERLVIGPQRHEEYWIPADDLEPLNEAIVGKIDVVRELPSPSTIEGRKRWFETYVESLDTVSVTAGPEDGPHPCPCCHYRTLAERGGFETCPVCFWEDDGQDEADAEVVRGGPNGSLSLRAARENFDRIGASDERSVRMVRAPKPDERSG